MNWIYDPWPWYIGGPLIAFVMLLLLLSEKKFGMSSNLRTICAAFGAGKSTPFFDYDWKSQRWNIIVILGAFVGGLIGAQFLSTQTAVDLTLMLSFNSKGSILWTQVRHICQKDCLGVLAGPTGSLYRF